jgi:hypothetical protein
MIKNWTKFALLAVIAGLVVLAGCDPQTTSDEIAVGDTVTVAGRDFTIDTIDDTDGAGGWIASASDGDVALSGRFAIDYTMESGTDYYLAGPVFIGLNDASASNTLTIQAGVTIYGDATGDPPGTLIIDRGAKIEATGTSSSPIVMTSSNDVGSRAPGDWGGVIINGLAPVQGGTAAGEGDTGTYGGPDPADDSGTLQYVVVQFAGTLFSPENELNGIAFQGVGNGTTVEYIQVHRNADDGVEFFGGSVGAKYIVLTGTQDDALDFDDGWTGSAQFVVIQDYQDVDAGNAIEGDGDPTDQIAPAQPVLANITAIGNPGTEDTSGPRFRRASNPDVYNSAFVNYAASEGISNASDSDEADPTPEFQGVVTDGTTDFTTGVTVDSTVFADHFNASAEADNDSVTPGEGNEVSWDPQPTSAIGGAVTTVPSTDVAGNALVTDADYIGAIDPAGTDWTAGWTSFPLD